MILGWAPGRVGGLGGLTVHRSPEDMGHQQRLKNPIDYPIGTPVGPVRSLNLSCQEP